MSDRNDPDQILAEVRHRLTGRTREAVQTSRDFTAGWVDDLEEARTRDIDQRVVLEILGRAELQLAELQRIYDLMVLEGWDTYDPSRDPQAGGRT